MQEYRSGHNEAVLKTVWVKAHGGSNPSSCARKNDRFRLVVFSIKSAFCGINPPVVDEIALR